MDLKIALMSIIAIGRRHKCSEKKRARPNFSFRVANKNRKILKLSTFLATENHIPISAFAVSFGECSVYFELASDIVVLFDFTEAFHCQLPVIPHHVLFWPILVTLDSVSFHHICQHHNQVHLSISS